MRKNIIHTIQSIARKMNMECPTITFKEDFQSGAYVVSLNQIILPTNRDSRELLFFGLHELRHAYQLKYIEEIKDALMLRYCYEIQYYDQIPYKKLFMEQEANAFAYYVMKELLHIDIEPSPLVKEMIEEFQKNNSLVFSAFL